MDSFFPGHKLSLNPTFTNSPSLQVDNTLSTPKPLQTLLAYSYFNFSVTPQSTKASEEAVAAPQCPTNLSQIQPRSTKWSLSPTSQKETTSASQTNESRENRLHSSTEKVLLESSHKNVQSRALLTENQASCSVNNSFADLLGFDSGNQGSGSSESDDEEINAQVFDELFSQTLNPLNYGFEQEDSLFFYSTKEKEDAISEKPKLLIEDVVSINKQEVSFGSQLPGKIVEESLELINKCNKEIVVEVRTKCLNAEVAHLEEYVYSARNNQSYDYNDYHQFVIAANSRFSFKVALKVPTVKITDKNLNASLVMSVKDLEGETNVSLTAKCLIPKISCPKKLHSKQLNCNVINLAAQIGKLEERKIPIKNSSDVPVIIELSLYHSSDELNAKDYMCVVQPKVTRLEAHSVGGVKMSIKSLKNFSKETKGAARRFLLIGKVRDSCLVYSFPFQIDFY